MNSLLLYRDKHGKMQYRRLTHPITNSYLDQILGTHRKMDGINTPKGMYFFITSENADTNRADTSWCKPSILVRDALTHQEQYRFNGPVVIVRLNIFKESLEYASLSKEDIQYLQEALDLDKKRIPVYVEVLHTKKFCDVYAFYTNQSKQIHA